VNIYFAKLSNEMDSQMAELGHSHSVTNGIVRREEVALTCILFDVRNANSSKVMDKDCL